MKRLCDLTVLCLLLGLPGEAAGQGQWEQPALGDSASGNPEVLFTFDDGPHEGYTPIILDTLKRHGVQAIFFMAGWRISKQSTYLEARRAIARRVLGDGHVIGNHTVNHARLCTISKSRAEWEIDEGRRLLAELVGAAIPYFRTPYGSRCARLEEMLAKRGIRHLHWDMDPREYLHHDSDATRRYLVRKLSKLTGRAVILMHDTQVTTTRVLPFVLDWIAAENVRRRAAGTPQIRILSYADVAREQLAPGLEQAASSAMRAISVQALGLMDRLLAPLVAHPPPRTSQVTAF
ncbi:MAG: polysaccharide deacetylase family protein [Deltaproteobacteria bacterium]|nr:polysaccharide deacetylase family protein [Deltaproteobacteria bacterium]